MDVRRGLASDVGSCNFHNGVIVTDDSFVLDHRYVWLLTGDGASFRICEKCRKELNRCVNRSTQ